MTTAIIILSCSVNLVLALVLIFLILSLRKEQSFVTEAFTKALDANQANSKLQIDLAMAKNQLVAANNAITELNHEIERENIARELAEGQRDDLLKAIPSGSNTIRDAIAAELQKLSGLSKPTGSGNP